VAEDIVTLLKDSFLSLQIKEWCKTSDCEDCALGKIIFQAIEEIQRLRSIVSEVPTLYFDDLLRALDNSDET
jgi:hypothetical protein